MKTSELTDRALDWAVSVAEMDTEDGNSPPPYSTDWAQGGPIIEREAIALTTQLTNKDWMAVSFHGDIDGFGPTPLIAAMRCYVASKLGDEIEIPEELK